MANITDKAFFDFLTENGVADEYSGYDGPTKLGWRQLFQQQQQQQQQQQEQQHTSNNCLPITNITNTNNNHLPIITLLFLLLI